MSKRKVRRAFRKYLFSFSFDVITPQPMPVPVRIPGRHNPQMPRSR